MLICDVLKQSKWLENIRNHLFDCKLNKEPIALWLFKKVPNGFINF